ncbi:hypothetical protein BGK46_06145 [Salinivibrio sp. SS2]|nr:hypothetical protein BGK46_06145 [Salinivibrio sp. DV]
MKNNNFDPVIVNKEPYSIGHLKDIMLNIDIDFSNGDTRTIAVHMRPTNHLFSRKVEGTDYENRPALTATGHWLTSYVHHEGNFFNVKGNPPSIKEHRIFCRNKWQDSFLFPSFVELIRDRPSHVTVLANAGDDKTCLSGILEIEERPDEVYLVFFTLTKVNSKEANMLIESAYCVDRAKNLKAKKLISNTRKEESKPFVVALKNVMEGRKPMLSVKKSRRAYKRKKKK